MNSDTTAILEFTFDQIGPSFAFQVLVESPLIPPYRMRGAERAGFSTTQLFERMSAENGTEAIQTSVSEKHGSFERRKSFRVTVHWELCFTKGSAVFSTRTCNLSSAGFYFESPESLAPGAIISCVLKVPTHRSQIVLWLSCTARVVRVESGNNRGLYGVGCQIEDYWFPHVRDRTRGAHS